MALTCAAKPRDWQGPYSESDLQRSINLQTTSFCVRCVAGMRMGLEAE